jgi:hypothetical protein
VQDFSHIASTKKKEEMIVALVLPLSQIFVDQTKGWPQQQAAAFNIQPLTPWQTSS